MKGSDSRRRRGARRQVARAAQEAGIAGLSFLRGIPGAHRRRVAHEWRRLWRRDQGRAGRSARGRSPGRVHVLRNADMDYSYRHSGVPDDYIFSQALFAGQRGDPAAIAAEMDKITESREATQPVKSRTGGSTFKNPPGQKAWQLIDAAGCRGLHIGGAQVSEMHCNFLINLGGATCRRYRDTGRDRAPPRQGKFRRRPRMGDQADRRDLVPASEVRRTRPRPRKSVHRDSRFFANCRFYWCPCEFSG